MNGPERLLANEDRWVTRMGAWFPGERVVYRGKDLFQDLRDLPWMGLLIYGITGRIPDANAVRLLEGIWMLCTSYPDPRLWNNRIAALAGTARSSAALAISAANAVSEATIYGMRPIIRAMDFLLRTQASLDQGSELEQIVVSELRTHRSIAGYGRPVIRKDERIEPIMALARDLGLADGRYVRLAFAVEQVLIRGRWRQQMNVAALAAGLVAELGFSPGEYYQYMCLGFSAGMFPCYQEASNKPEGAYFPLRCTRVKYAGTMRRRWDSAEQKQKSSQLLPGEASAPIPL